MTDVAHPPENDADAMLVTSLRDGETALPFDPGREAPTAGLVFIGRVLSPWRSREECPKNVPAARSRNADAEVEIDPVYRAGLAGLEAYSHIILLSWLHRSQRNLIVQKPRHAPEARGVFALRSPVRPNPVGVHVVRLINLDAATGRLRLDGIDLLDGTPIIDVKPYFASTDAFPEATRPGL